MNGTLYKYRHSFTGEWEYLNASQSAQWAYCLSLHEQINTNLELLREFEHDYVCELTLKDSVRALGKAGRETTARLRPIAEHMVKSPCAYHNKDLVRRFVETGECWCYGSLVRALAEFIKTVKVF